MTGKPFVKWVGGKSRLIHQLDSLLPKNLNNYTYIEPFVGGGAMLFYILEKYNIKNAVINDLNSSLINTYNVIRDDVSNLMSSLKNLQDYYNDLVNIEDKQALYYEIRDKFNHSGYLSKLESAAYFIFLNKTTFNGLYRENSSGVFNAPFGKKQKINLYDSDNLKNISKLLSKVTILNGDYAETMKYATEPSTFFYLDPPYRQVFTGFTKTGYDDSEQLRLKEFCDNINNSGFLFMQSNSKCIDGFFENHYKDYKIHEVEIHRNIGAKRESRGIVKEIVICNY